MLTLLFLAIVFFFAWLTAIFVGYFIVVSCYLIYWTIVAIAKVSRSAKLEAIALRVKGKSTVGLDGAKNFKEARAEARKYEYSTLWKQKFEDEFGMKGPKFGQGFHYQTKRLEEIKKEARKEAEQYKAEERKKQAQAKKEAKMAKKAKK